jgi:hypothetical protein
MRRLLAAFVLAAAVPAAVSADDVVPRDSWVAGVKSALPVAFCQDGSYFRSCFRITAEECESTAASATRVCLAGVQDQLPTALRQPADGAAWGQKVGSCAGGSFEAAKAAQKIDSQKCNDPSHWM